MLTIHFSTFLHCLKSESLDLSKGKCVCDCGVAVLSRRQTVGKTALQVEIKTNYSFRVLVLGVLQVAAASGERMAEKEVRWRERVMM